MFSCAAEKYPVVRTGYPSTTSHMEVTAALLLRVTYICGCITYQYYSSAQPIFFAACKEIFINDDSKWFLLAPSFVAMASDRHS